MRITGDDAGTKAEITAGTFGVEIINTGARTRLTRVTIRSFDTGLRVENSWLNAFTDCYILRNRVGVHQMSTSLAQVWRGGEIASNDVGFIVEYSVQLAFHGVTIEANDDWGVRLMGDANKTGVSFIDCYFERNGAACISVEDAQTYHMLVQGCHFSNTERYVWLQPTARTTGSLLPGCVAAEITMNSFRSNAEGPDPIAIGIESDALETVVGPNHYKSTGVSICPPFDPSVHDAGIDTVYPSFQRQTGDVVKMHVAQSDDPAIVTNSLTGEVQWNFEFTDFDTTSGSGFLPILLHLHGSGRGASIGVIFDYWASFQISTTTSGAIASRDQDINNSQGENTPVGRYYIAGNGNLVIAINGPSALSWLRLDAHLCDDRGPELVRDGRGILVSWTVAGVDL